MRVMIRMLYTAMDELGIHKFRAKILETNIASLKLFQNKLNFVEVIFFVMHACEYKIRCMVV